MLCKDLTSRVVELIRWWWRIRNVDDPSIDMPEDLNPSIPVPATEPGDAIALIY